MILRLATWNVLAPEFYERLKPERFCERYPPAPLDASARLDRVCARVRELAARNDVVCLQEVECELVERLEPLRREGFTLHYEQRPEGKPDGVAALVRDALPIEARARHEVVISYRGTGSDGTPERSDRARRVTLHLRLATPMACVNLLVAHAEWDDGCNKLDGETPLGTAQAARLMGILAASPADVDIIAGDLNSSERCPCVRELLTQSFVAATRAGTTQREPTSIDWDHATGGFRTSSIDWILVRGARAELVGEVRVPPNAPCEELPSDHLPVEAVVRVGTD